MDEENRHNLSSLLRPRSLNTARRVIASFSLSNKRKVHGQPLGLQPCARVSHLTSLSRLASSVIYLFIPLLLLRQLYRKPPASPTSNPLCGRPLLLRPFNASPSLCQIMLCVKNLPPQTARQASSAILDTPHGLYFELRVTSVQFAQAATNRAEPCSQCASSHHLRAARRLAFIA